LAYFTQADLENAVGSVLVYRLLDDDGDGSIAAGVVTDIQTRADAIVNGYLSRVYTVSAITASVPSIVKSLAVDVAVELMYRRRPESIDERGNTPWSERYREAMRLLREVGEGKFRLDVNGTPATPVNVRGSVRTGTYENTAVSEGFVKDGSGAF
jgi:phage gp36-like protein